MFHQRKSLRDQVIVITGATSGIGLATARAAARRKARLVLAARNGDDLARVRRELEAHSPGVAFVETDVAKKADLEALAVMARTSFGGFDTWVNNAGQSIFGRLDDVADEDHERLFQVNFWGTVHGSLIAAEHFKRHGGGTIVNVGSVAGDFAIPLQGMYSASKHAIRGFTDALRMELAAENAPINVTLVKPAAIDTPLPGRSRNYMTGEPTLPPPAYRPHEVALAILSAATEVRRDIYVGGVGRVLSAVAQVSPHLFDVVAAPAMMSSSKQSEAPRNPAGRLHASGEDADERGGTGIFTLPFSAYTRLTRNPFDLAATILGRLRQRERSRDA